MLVDVDSSALKANYDMGENYHEKASGLMCKITSRETEITSFVTTVTLTRFAHSHKKAAELAEAALSSRFMRIVFSDELLFSEALKIFNEYSDKEWSFTDCVSFATMRKYALKAAFTFDPHFRQFGFATIP